jgi:hypothetical protein
VRLGWGRGGLNCILAPVCKRCVSFVRSWLHKNRRERNTGSLPDPADHRSDRALRAALHDYFLLLLLKSKVHFHFRVEFCLVNNLPSWGGEESVRGGKSLVSRTSVSP